jgi:hypothetical protein
VPEERDEAHVDAVQLRDGLADGEAPRALAQAIDQDRVMLPLARDEMREALIAALARASNAHVEAVVATRALAGRLVAGTGAQRPASADGASE